MWRELRGDLLPSLYLWDDDAYYRTEFARIVLYYRIAAGMVAILLLLWVMKLVVCSRRHLSGI
jgi:hypothetical protein